MKDARKYQRYAVNIEEDAVAQGEVMVKGEVVRLVNFSLSGLCFLSKTHFSPGAISFSVEFGDHGKIELIGKIVRVTEEGDLWRIAVDLTETYKLDILRKV